jgi:hypothetical protein
MSNTGDTLNNAIKSNSGVPVDAYNPPTTTQQAFQQYQQSKKQPASQPVADSNCINAKIPNFKKGK